MSTTSISGANKLAERIVAEAEADARATLEENEKSLRAIRAESDKTIAAKRAELQNQLDTAVKNLISGYQTRAMLDGKKDALKRKRAVIDAAFSRAYDAFLSLDAESRKRICARMLEAEADGGETIVPAKADRKSLEALAAAAPQKKLSVSKNDAEIDGGFVLLGAGYEKDCSFRSLLNVVRGEEETSVYQLLFD
jgi:vacuolar-type H+-ATPase subunit E/Vma4